MCRVVTNGGYKYPPYLLLISVFSFFLLNAFSISPFTHLLGFSEAIDEEITQGVDDVIVDTVFFRELGELAAG